MFVFRNLDEKLDPAKAAARRLRLTRDFSDDYGSYSAGEEFDVYPYGGVSPGYATVVAPGRECTLQVPWDSVEVCEAEDNGEKLAAATEDILGEILGLFGIDESGEAGDAAERIKEILDKAGLEGGDAEKAVAAAEKKAAAKAGASKVAKAMKAVRAELEKLDEAEDEFDAEDERYDELKTRLLGGQAMKYEEMEELLAAAKSRNDQKVIGVLKNVVGDPAADAVTEDDEDRDVIDELLDKIGALVKKLKPGKLRDKLEDAVDMLSVDESGASGIVDEIEEKEDVLPDCVVNEAVEALRRMY